MEAALANIQDPFTDMEELIEQHASEEQNDWKILFQDYKNIGSVVADADELALNTGGTK